MLYRRCRCNAVFGKMTLFFFSKSLINSCSSNHLESDHTNTLKEKPHGQGCQMTEHVNPVTHLMTNTTLSHKQVGCTQTHKPAPPDIRHRVTVGVQGETEEAFDRVSDIVQCLLLHCFSITRQYVRSSLAAATSFSLADLHARTGLPIFFIYSGFLE